MNAQKVHHEIVFTPRKERERKEHKRRKGKISLTEILKILSLRQVNYKIKERGRGRMR